MVEGDLGVVLGDAEDVAHLGKRQGAVDAEGEDLALALAEEEHGLLHLGGLLLALERVGRGWSGAGGLLGVIEGHQRAPALVAKLEAALGARVEAEPGVAEDSIALRATARG